MGSVPEFSDVAGGLLARKHSEYLLARQVGGGRFVHPEDEPAVVDHADIAATELS